MRIDPKLPPGAYLVQGDASGNKERALILVTYATVVVRNEASKTVVYACNALTGAPLADARVRLWNGHDENSGMSSIRSSHDHAMVWPRWR